MHIYYLVICYLDAKITEEIPSNDHVMNAHLFPYSMQTLSLGGGEA